MAGLNTSFFKPLGQSSGTVNPSNGSFTGYQGSTYTPSSAPPVPFTSSGAASQASQPWRTPQGYTPTPSQSGYDVAGMARQTVQQYTPDLLGIDAQRARGEALAQFLGGTYYPGKEQGLRNTYDIGNRNADLDLAGIGVQRGAANRDAKYYQDLLDLMPYYKGYSDRELATSLREAARQGNMERLGINSDYTNRGAFFSGMRGIKNYNSYLSQAAAEDRANTGYGRDMLSQREKTLGLERSKAMTGDQLAQLDIDAQRVGLNRESLRNALEQGLNSLGYDKFMSLSQLMEMRASTDAAKRDLANQIFESILSNGQALASGQLGGAYANGG